MLDDGIFLPSRQSMQHSCFRSGRNLLFEGVVCKHIRGQPSSRGLFVCTWTITSLRLNHVRHDVDSLLCSALWKSFGMEEGYQVVLVN